MTIRLPVQPGVLVVPSAAIARGGSRNGVWQQVGGRAHFKPVLIGSQGQAGVTQIRSGLAEGDRVIVYSTAPLKQRVRIRAQAIVPR